MKNISTVAVQITKEKSGYSAVTVGVFGVCATESKTYEGAVKSIREALTLHLEGLGSIKKKMETSVVLLPVYA
jgi:predicted RNase H-like HicB family nuclease